MDKRLNCYVWLPHSYSGRGPAESCARIIESFDGEGIDTRAFVSRAKKLLPGRVHAVEAAGGLFHKVPFRLISEIATQRLSGLFGQSIDEAPSGTIAYFWPNAPISLVERARTAGAICVREMINSPLANSKPILDLAYEDAGLVPSHGITNAMVAEETAELALYDFIFSSNAQVDAALRSLDIPQKRILKSSFGWVQSRFSNANSSVDDQPRTGFRAVFVGLMNVRKGIPTLLKAWDAAGVDGELLLAGTVEECLKPVVEDACAKGTVRQLGHVSDVASLYRSCDAFIFPTHEEGGPQVTYEAAACGISIITTPMGAARLVEHNQTGLIIQPGDVAGLAAAIERLAHDKELRKSLSGEALRRVGTFEYQNVGTARARLLRQLGSHSENSEASEVSHDP